MTVATIEGYELPIKQVGNERLITFEEVDLVHDLPSGTARKIFHSKREDLLEQEDYYRITTTFADKLLCNWQSKNMSQVASRRGTILLTATGYTAIARSIKSQKTWNMEKKVIKDYFWNFLPIEEPLASQVTIDDIMVQNSPEISSEEKKFYIDTITSLTHTIEKMAEQNASLLKEKKEVQEKKDIHRDSPINFKTSYSLAGELDLFAKSGKPHGRFVDYLAEILEMKTGENPGYEDDYIKITSSNVTKIIEYKPKAQEKIKNLCFSGALNSNNTSVVEYVKGSNKGAQKHIKIIADETENICFYLSRYPKWYKED